MTDDSKPSPTHWRKPDSHTINVCGTTGGPFAHRLENVSCPKCRALA